jgi:hypothetical protein
MKIVWSVLLMLLLCVPVFASGNPCDSSIGGAILNQCVEHPTFVDNDTIYDRDDPMGVGVDFVVYQSDQWWSEEITVEPRWDFANDEGQLFFVARVNLQKLWAPNLKQE